MLIRRAVRFLHKLGCSSEPLLYKLSEKAVDIYGAFYDELVLSKEFIASVLRKEEELFAKTVENGLKNLDALIEVRLNEATRGEKFLDLDGHSLFNLYSTYGLPLEIVEDVIEDYRKQGFSIELDYEGYEKAREEHSKASSTSAFNVSVTSEKSLSQLLQAYPKTEFLGYAQEETEAEILMILDKDKNPISEINFSDILAKKSSNLVSEKLVSTENHKETANGLVQRSHKDDYEFFLVLDKTTFMLSLVVKYLIQDILLKTLQG